MTQREGRLVYQERDGDLAVEVWQDNNGHRKIDLIRQYDENGEWKVTTRMGYAYQHRGALLLRAAQKWINEQDKVQCPRIVYTDLDHLRLLAEWH